MYKYSCHQRYSPRRVSCITVMTKSCHTLSIYFSIISIFIRFFLLQNSHLSALTTKLKNVERIHNSEKSDRYSSETSSYLHRLPSLSIYAYILLSNNVPINTILKTGDVHTKLMLRPFVRYSN